MRVLNRAQTILGEKLSLSTHIFQKGVQTRDMSSSPSGCAHEEAQAAEGDHDDEDDP
jgi:hypothetical protein